MSRNHGNPLLWYHRHHYKRLPWPQKPPTLCFCVFLYIARRFLQTSSFITTCSPNEFSRIIFLISLGSLGKRRFFKRSSYFSGFDFGVFPAISSSQIPPVSLIISPASEILLTLLVFTVLSQFHEYLLLHMTPTAFSVWNELQGHCYPPTPHNGLQISLVPIINIICYLSPYITNSHFRPYLKWIMFFVRWIKPALSANRDITLAFTWTCAPYKTGLIRSIRRTMVAFSRAIMTNGLNLINLISRSGARKTNQDSLYLVVTVGGDR